MSYTTDELIHAFNNKQRQTKDYTESLYKILNDDNTKQTNDTHEKSNNNKTLPDPKQKQNVFDRLRHQLKQSNK